MNTTSFGVRCLPVFFGAAIGLAACSVDDAVVSVSRDAGATGGAGGRAGSSPGGASGSGIGGALSAGGSNAAGGGGGSSGAGGNAGNDVEAGVDAGDAAPPCPPVGIEGTGRGLRAEYFSSQDLTNLTVTRIDPAIDFDWGTRAPELTLPLDHFSVRWTGQVQPRFSGTYTFYTDSDDGIRVTVDGKQIINDYTDHVVTEDLGTVDLVGGQKYDLNVEYFDSGAGALAQLFWSSDCQPREVVPSSQLYFTAPVCAAPSIGMGAGVKGDYFDNADLSNLVATRTDATIAFDWSAGNSPDPGIEGTTYSARWTGQVQSKYTDAVTFYTISDDGVRLLVDEKVLIDNWNDHGRTEDAATVPLVAGQMYNLRLEFYNNGGSANAALSWGSQCQAKETIPATQLFRTYTGIVCDPPVTGTGTGLRGEYYDNIDFTNLALFRPAENVTFDFGQASPDPLIGVDTFSIRWTGQVMARYTGPLTFHVLSDDGLRLWVNGQLLIDDFVDHGPRDDTGTINAIAGQKYDLRLDYYENGGFGSVRLLWSGACQPLEPVPPTQLFNTGFTGPLPEGGLADVSAPPADASVE